MARTAKTNVLTAMKVKAYAEGPATTRPLHDGSGLYLRRRDAGAYWYLRLTDPATKAEQWHRMFPDDPQGGYPHKSLADARAEAKKLWEKRSAGVDPRVARLQKIADDKAKADKAALEASRRLTVRQLFDRWASVELKPHVGADGQTIGRKDGGEYIRQQFERKVFPKLGSVAAVEVRKVDLLPLLDAVKADGKLRTANVLLASLKHVEFHAILTRFFHPILTHPYSSPAGSRCG